MRKLDLLSKIYFFFPEQERTKILAMFEQFSAKIVKPDAACDLSFFIQNEGIFQQIILYLFPDVPLIHLGIHPWKNKTCPNTFSWADQFVVIVQSILGGINHPEVCQILWGINLADNPLEYLQEKSPNEILLYAILEVVNMHHLSQKICDAFYQFFSPMVKNDEEKSIQLAIVCRQSNIADIPNELFYQRLKYFLQNSSLFIKQFNQKFLVYLSPDKDIQIGIKFITNSVHNAILIGNLNIIEFLLDFPDYGNYRLKAFKTAFGRNIGGRFAHTPNDSQNEEFLFPETKPLAEIIKKRQYHLLDYILFRCSQLSKNQQNDYRRAIAMECLVKQIPVEQYSFLLKNDSLEPQENQYPLALFFQSVFNRPKTIIRAYEENLTLFKNSRVLANYTGFDLSQPYFYQLQQTAFDPSLPMQTESLLCRVTEKPLTQLNYEQHLQIAKALLEANLATPGQRNGFQSENPYIRNYLTERFHREANLYQKYFNRWYVRESDISANLSEDPLFHAIHHHQEITQPLTLEVVNRKLWDGTTPLYLSAKMGNFPLVKQLLEQGADPNAVLFINGHTALHAAVFSKNSDIISILHAFHADIHAKLLIGKETPLQYAELLLKETEKYCDSYESEKRKGIVVQLQEIARSHANKRRRCELRFVDEALKNMRRGESSTHKLGQSH